MPTPATPQIPDLNDPAAIDHWLMVFEQMGWTITRDRLVRLLIALREPPAELDDDIDDPPPSDRIRLGDRLKGRG